jgi:hypothetical protein
MSFRFQPSNLSFSSSSYGDAGGAGSGVQYYAPLRQMGAANATDNKKEVPKGSAAYNAIQSQIANYYGPMPAMGFAAFRDVYGLTPNALPRQRTSSQFVPEAYRDGYIYRQFSDGRIFIQATPVKAPARATGATVRSSSGTPSQTQIPTRTTAAAPAEPALPSTEIDEAQGEASTGPDWKKYALIGIPALLFVGVAAYMVFGGSQDKEPNRVSAGDRALAAMANPRKKKKKASKKAATKRKSTRKVKAKTKAKAKSKIKAKAKSKAKTKSKAKKHAKAKTSKTKAKKSRKSA